MAAIHHEAVSESGACQFHCRILNSFKVIVGPAVATAQHQVTIGVTGGAHNRRVPIPVDAEEMVRF